MSEVEPVFGCQHKECATEVSYPADMLRIWDGKPICEFCFDDLPMIDRQKGDDEDDWITWSDLDPFVPEHVRALQSLTAERDRLRKALEPFAAVPSHGIHGGPLVVATVLYEDGTEEDSARHKGRLSSDEFKRARTALKEKTND